MSEINLEYLFISKSEEDTSNNKLEILDLLIEEKVQDKDVTFFENRNEYIFTLSSNKIGNYTYVKLTHTCNRLKLQIIKDIESIDLRINIFSSKNNFQRISLIDDISRYYSNRLNPLFFQYEIELRKLIYLIVPPSVDRREGWIETFDTEVTDNIKKKNKGKYKKESILEYLTLYDIEQYLFNLNYIDLIDSDENNIIGYKYREVKTEQLIKILTDGNYKISSKPYSLWGKYFSSVVQINNKHIENDMSELRDGRNIVSHHKTLDSKKFVHLKKLVNNYVKKFKNLNYSIINNQLDEESMQIAYSDLNTLLTQSLKSISSIEESTSMNLKKSIAEINLISSDSLQNLNRSTLGFTDAIKTMTVIPEGTIQALSKIVSRSDLIDGTLQNLNKSTLGFTDAIKAMPVISGGTIKALSETVSRSSLINDKLQNSTKSTQGLIDEMKKILLLQKKHDKT